MRSGFGFWPGPAGLLTRRDSGRLGRATSSRAGAPAKLLDLRMGGQKAESTRCRKLRHRHKRRRDRRCALRAYPFPGRPEEDGFDYGRIVRCLSSSKLRSHPTVRVIASKCLNTGRYFPARSFVRGGQGKSRSPSSSLEFAEEPGAGVGPPALGRCERDAQGSEAASEP